MNRRQYLAAVGVAGAGTVLAGCLSDGEYGTYEAYGQEVPLAPVEDTYEWYQEGALFLDARSPMEYAASHIEGAKLSPADAPEFDHPTDDVAPDRRIVTYCVCPHALAGTRAAELLNDGFENVYAIDEGLNGWIDNEYPMASGTGSPRITDYSIVGRTDPSHAGEQLWLEAPTTGQQYVTSIDDDGTFEMTFEFVDVDDETVAVLELPDRRVRRTLGELSEGEVRL